MFWTVTEQQWRNKTIYTEISMPRGKIAEEI